MHYCSRTGNLSFEETFSKSDKQFWQTFTYKELLFGIALIFVGIYQVAKVCLKVLKETKQSTKTGADSPYMFQFQKDTWESVLIWNFEL